VIFGQSDFKSYFVTADRGVAEVAETPYSNTTQPHPLAAPLPAACVVLKIQFQQRTVF